MTSQTDLYDFIWDAASNFSTKSYRWRRKLDCISLSYLVASSVPVSNSISIASFFIYSIALLNVLSPAPAIKMPVWALCLCFSYVPCSSANCSFSYIIFLKSFSGYYFFSFVALLKKCFSTALLLCLYHLFISFFFPENLYLPHLCLSILLFPPCTASFLIFSLSIYKMG